MGVIRSCQQKTRDKRDISEMQEKKRAISKPDLIICPMATEIRSKEKRTVTLASLLSSASTVLAMPMFLFNTLPKLQLRLQHDSH